MSILVPRFDVTYVRIYTYPHQNPGKNAFLKTDFIFHRGSLVCGWLFVSPTCLNAREPWRRQRRKVDLGPVASTKTAWEGEEERRGNQSAGDNLMRHGSCCRRGRAFRVLVDHRE